MNVTNIQSHNVDPTIDITGTSLMYSLDINYSELVEFFGQPLNYNIGEFDETVEWHIRFDNSEGESVVASIYRFISMDKARLVQLWSVGAREKMTAIDVVDVILAMREKRSRTAA